MKKFFKKIINSCFFNALLDILVLILYAAIIGSYAQVLFGLDAVSVGVFVVICLFLFPGDSVRSIAFPFDKIDTKCKDKNKNQQNDDV